MLLAIETSCDETAVSVFDSERFLAGETKLSALLRSELVSSQVALHASYGGVVPEIASREHLVNLPLLVEEAFAAGRITAEDIRTVVVTRGPGLKGCLLVGMSYAKAFAWSRGIPLLGVSHLEGHVFAGELGESLSRLPTPLLVLLVSGGHTELLEMHRTREYRVVARTKDDAVGEAFDKCASLLGLPYPGGPALAALAGQGDRERFRFPIGMAGSEADFSFSGVKTAVLRTVEQLGRLDESTRADLAAGIQESFIDALLQKTERALRKLRPEAFLLTGGVAANIRLRERLTQLLTSRGIRLIVPGKRWCTDNASMIGMLGLRIVEANIDRFRSWRAHGSAETLLSPLTPGNIGVAPRWPIEERADS